MDIREHHSVFELFIESFKLVNRACGTFVMYVLLGVFGMVFIGAACWGLHTSMLVIYIAALVYSIFLGVVLINIIGTKAENDIVSLPDTFAASVLPTIYVIILQLVYFLLMIPVSVWYEKFLKNSLTANITLLFIWCFIFIRFGFAPLAIILRGQGPLSSLLYSWKTTKDHSLTVLAAWVITFIFVLLLMGGVAAVGYAVYTHTSPAYLMSIIPMGLNQLTLPWIMGIILLGIIPVFINLSIYTYGVLVFLNLDYTVNRAVSNANEHPQMPSMQVKEEYLTPAPEANAIHQSIENDFMPHIEDVQLVKASVKDPSGEDALAQHLDQVYQPKPENVVEYTEEDRMPTILFDEDMAKEIEQTRAQWEAQQKKKNAPGKDGPDNDSNAPIKMSK